MDTFSIILMVGIVAYIGVGIIWTRFQFWRWSADIIDGLMSHYSLRNYPHWSISKGQIIFQLLLWLPVFLFQIIILVVAFLLFGLAILLSFLSGVEEKITP